MNHIRRLVCILSALAVSMLALGAPAFAERVPVPGTGDQPFLKTQLVAVSGMPGWQIGLIAAGAALLGAVLAVLLDRARIARRRAAAGAA